MNIEMKKHTLRRILTEGLWAADERSISIRVSEHLQCLGVWMYGRRCLKDESVWRRRVFDGESKWFGWVSVSEGGECLTVRVFDLAIWEWVWDWQIWVSESEFVFESLRVTSGEVFESLSVWKFESDEWGLKVRF